jgi:hypothetical protein
MAETKRMFPSAVKSLLVAGLILGTWGAFGKAYAANPDTLTVTVTPSGALYGVLITSPEVQGYDFGAVNVGATTISTKPIAVQNTGNISEYFSLGVVDITAGGVAWTNAASPANVTYVLQGQFVATGAAQPADASFAGAANNVPVTPPVTAASKFNQGTTRTIPSNSQDLWLQLKMPTGLAESGQHTLVLSINGQTN